MLISGIIIIDDYFHNYEGNWTDGQHVRDSHWSMWLLFASCWWYGTFVSSCFITCTNAFPHNYICRKWDYSLYSTYVHANRDNASIIEKSQDLNLLYLSSHDLLYAWTRSHLSYQRFSGWNKPLRFVNNGRKFDSIPSTFKVMFLGSSSSLHSEACNALGVSDGVIHSKISWEATSLGAVANCWQK